MSQHFEPFEGRFLFRRHYPALDFLRAAAIFMVMINHFKINNFLKIVASNNISDNIVGSLLDMGSRGVPLFFVLSGFLIGGQILEELQRGHFNFKKFYLKRFWRIFPPYYVSLLVVVVLYFTGLAASEIVMPGLSTASLLKDVFYHLLYLQNFTGATIQSNLYWTLGIEEQFYLVTPVILFVLYRKFGMHLDKILITMLCLGIFSQVVLNYNTVDFNGYKPWFSINFYYLISGVLAAHIYIKHYESLLNATIKFKTFIFCMPVAVFIVALLWNEELTFFKVCIYTMFLSFGFATIVLWSVITSFNTVVPIKKVFGYIAKLSYTMYLYHIILLGPFYWLITPLVKMLDKVLPVRTPGYFFLIFCFYFIFILIISSVTYMLIDRPCMNIRKRQIARWNDPI